MKYIDALKKYNENKDKWCIPRKGSVDYLKIRNMIEDKATPTSLSSLKKIRIKLELLNVSGRNNNCFFNSVYLLVKETKDNKWKSGSHLRKFLCDIFLQKAMIAKTIRRFVMYLELVQLYIHNRMGSEDIAQLLSVNSVEIRSLRKANIKRIDLHNNVEIERLLDKHLKVLGRMPSQPEMSLTINYIKNNNNIVVLPIILDNTNLQDDMLDKIRKKVREKLENVMRASGSSRLSHSTKNYKYGVIITDNTHYQLLKINNRVLSTIDEIGNFIASQGTSFSFHKTNIISRSSS